MLKRKIDQQGVSSEKNELSGAATVTKRDSRVVTSQKRVKKKANISIEWF